MSNIDNRPASPSLADIHKAILQLSEMPQLTVARIPSASSGNVNARSALTAVSNPPATLAVDSLPTTPLSLSGITERACASPSTSTASERLCCNHEMLLRVAEDRIQHLEQEIVFLRNKVDGKLNVIIDNYPSGRQALKEYLPINRPREGVFPGSNFELVPLENERELKEFNRVLCTDADYELKVVQFLQRKISCADVKNRMHQAIDLLFSKAFFAQITWTGLSKTGEQKVEFRRYSKVLQLFIPIAGNELPTPKYVEEFLKLKLKHAKSRVHIPATKATSSHKKPRFT
ncbi:uncharacterized protein LOC128304049 [Anopheles moucheti]|uniref:uncharacterized protein LOC128304049 n=1 Tax=Anopheles moucheti TaxID=186751 RepID=UPI0022F0F300|nr:uncharacterized protein LOC128304049 [Anopheles moucheti]